MIGVIKKIFGDKHEKDLKTLWPMVKEINDETLAKTLFFKSIYKNTYLLQRTLPAGEGSPWDAATVGGP